ncbi:MAG: hypothetical protein A2408_02795 [Candidatus Yonathbacteria bacterium RIFOXYC1_FULL_52_10]|uniref:ATP-dependent Clp protease proteolytic subunit n=1 Tax=Candidatus Yonathbacteria bacterium RIFOXYD1_FULL_52_36 TaxID=1802730 RepID=A0A1G2SM84_9BACT|nr:MAG: hypothetical protein A2408_02795 [Candidatus Yonathbacteria bacterium RIFOXYC1_FULL_52_10]OHA85501.1 MAG: hypothetical protein A2591_01435 [Candidatus Yonathbacteria bacterium RIFOXYD1_FULL_52_36]
MGDIKRKFFEETVPKRVLFISGKITADMEKELSHSFIYLNAMNDDPITLYINSPGGDVLPGLDIYDWVRLSRAPVHGIVVGHAASMASVILQGCAKRSIARHASIMIHTIRIYVELDDLMPENIGNSPSINDAKKEQEWIYKIFQERTGKEMSEIHKVFAEKTKFSAEEAKAFCLVDETI